MEDFMAPFLNIIIGIVFTYLILSLVASEIQEQLAAILEYRAVHLKRAIKVLLGEDKLPKNDKSLTNLLYENSAIRDLNQYATGFFIRNIFRTRWRLSKKDREEKYSEGPSYIPAETFALSLLEVIQDQLPSEKKLDPKSDTSESIIEKIDELKFTKETKKRLTQLIKRIDLKTERLKLTDNNNPAETIPIKLLQQEIATWYRQSIAPSSGVYKRNAKGLSILIGLLMAVLFNINVFNIINSLQNQDITASLVTNAEKLVQNKTLIENCIKAQPDIQGGTVDPDQIKQQCSSNIKSLANTLNEQTPTLDIGWKTDKDWSGQFIKEITSNTGKAVLGWLLSAIAIAMGPPFLFDVLNRFMNVRNAAQPILPSSQHNSPT
jgi:hypothetical protein